MAKKNITLDDVLYMDKQDFKEMLVDLSKQELSQVEKVLNDYITTSKQPRVGDEGNSRLKLNFVKNAKKDKSILKKVIAKVQTEAPAKTTSAIRPKPTAPTLKSASNTPRNTGVKYNQSQSRGQGDFFGSPSAFRFIKSIIEDAQSNNDNPAQIGFDFQSKSSKVKRVSSPKSAKLTISHIEPKALKQLKDALGVIAKAEPEESNSSKPRVKRVTKHEKEKLAIRKQEAELRKEHLDEIKFKHRSDKSLELRKIREHAKVAERRFESQRVSEEFKDKVEKNKTRRLKLSAELKRDLSNNHVELNKIKLNTARLARQRAKDQAEARERLQEQRKRQMNRSQMERHLHGIHPALGMLYSMQQNKRDSNPSANKGGGLGMEALLGTGAIGGAVGGLGAGAGKGLLKGASKMRGGGIAVLSSAILGLIEGAESNDAAKGVATFGGSLVGMRLGAMAGAMVGGPVGGIVGGILGGLIGETAIKTMYEGLFGKKNDSTSPIAGTGRFASLNPKTPSAVAAAPKPAGKPGRLASLGTGNTNVAKVPSSNTKDLLNYLGVNEGGDYNTIFGGKKVDLTNMTLDEVQAFQRDASNFPKGGASRAVGKYQFITKTLAEEIKASGLDPKTTKFTPEIQDMLITNRLKRTRGLDSASPEQLATNLAKEFASVPVLKDMKGFHRDVKRGESFYAGDGLNKSLIKPEEFESQIKNFASLRQEKAPVMTAALSNADMALQQKTNAAKSQPTNVVIQGGSSNSSPTVVNNNTTIHAPTTDATIRQVAVLSFAPARVL
jgi:hypothetical protein